MLCAGGAIQGAQAACAVPLRRERRQTQPRQACAQGVLHSPDASCLGYRPRGLAGPLGDAAMPSLLNGPHAAAGARTK
jgi:hypothetical protein